VSLAECDDVRPREQHPDRLRWNDRYRSDAAGAEPPAPSEWLTLHEPLLRAQPRGRALDVAAGRGRNALYLAELGFETEAADLSDVALEALEARASAVGLRVLTRWMDLGSEPLPAAHYQVVACFNYLQRDLFPRLEAALAPGGLLFVETLCRDHVEVLGRRFNPRYTLERDELLEAFAGLEVLEHRQGVFGPSERPRGVASLVARRPTEGRSARTQC